MDSTHPLIAVKTHYHDRLWLDAHAETLFDAISDALQQGAEGSARAVDSLLCAYPYVIGHSDVKKWSKLLQDALMAYEKQNPPRRIAAQHPVTALYLTTHEGDEVIEAEFNVAIKRARKRIRPLMIVEAYTNLMRLFAFNHGGSFDRQHFYHALELARQVCQPEADARVRVAIAYLHAYLGEDAQAFEQARQAYTAWHPTGDERHQGLSAFAVGSSLVRQGQFPLAVPWLQRAADRFTDIGRPDYHGYACYEIGCYYLKHGDVIGAQSWLNCALEQIAIVEEPFMLALARHALGEAHMRQGDYEPAKSALYEALAHWESAGERMQAGRTLQVLARIEGLTGNHDAAHNHLNQSEAHLNNAEDNPARAELLAALHALREALHQGGDLNAV